MHQVRVDPPHQPTRLLWMRPPLLLLLMLVLSLRCSGQPSQSRLVQARPAGTQPPPTLPLHSLLRRCGIASNHGFQDASDD